MSTQVSSCDSLSAQEILQGARDLISDPAHFCQVNGAETADGKPIAFDSPEATRWCVYGAILRTAGLGPAADGAIQLLKNACETLFGDSRASLISDGENGHSRILEALALATKDVT